MISSIRSLQRCAFGSGAPSGTPHGLSLLGTGLGLVIALLSLSLILNLTSSEFSLGWVSRAFLCLAQERGNRQKSRSPFISHQPQFSKTIEPEFIFTITQSLTRKPQRGMGIGKVVDAVLFMYYLFMAVVSLLFDSQTCLPSHLYPNFLIQAKSHYARDYGDYLVSNKPHFFVGLVALELIVQWPLLIANMYAIVANKNWFNVTCLIQGVCSFTSMVAILSDLMGTQKESDKLFMIYGPFMGFSILAILRSLVPASRKTSSTHVTRSSVSRKKRA